MNNLKKIRKSRGIGQVEIAHMLGVTQSSYSRYEAGLRDIPNDILVKLTSILNASVDEILAVDTDPEPIGKPIEINYQPEFTNDVMRVYEIASLRCGAASRSSS